MKEREERKEKKKERKRKKKEKEERKKEKKERKSRDCVVFALGAASRRDATLQMVIGPEWKWELAELSNGHDNPDALSVITVGAL